jgi:hypothetical protein
MRLCRFVITIYCACSLLPAGIAAPAGVRADLDGDGKAETVSIRPRSGGQSAAVVVSRGGKRLFEGVRLSPWKAIAPDVDGDGKHEVAVGVYKKSRFDPVMAKRLFIYKFEGGKLLPKWLGSRLSRRFTDFRFADIDKDGRDELVAQEYDLKGSYESLYRWNGFGFDFMKDRKTGRGRK